MKQKLIPKNLNPSSKIKYTNNKSDNKNNIYVYGYPLVDAISEGLIEYFKNNPNIAGMAIGAGLNRINGRRRVVLNPNIQNINARNSVYMNESYRHYFDENNTELPELTNVQRNAYKGTVYDGLDEQIKRTEAARYLSGDPSHHLNKEQKQLLRIYTNFIYPGRTLPEVIITLKMK